MKKKIVFCLILLFVLSAGLFASEQAQDLPWEDTIDTVMKSVQSIILPVGVIMIVISAFVIMFTEGQGVKKFMWVIMAIGIAAGATGLVTRFMGSGAGYLMPEPVKIETVIDNDLL